MLSKTGGIMAKTPDELRAEIKAARDQLADGVRGLSSEIHPSVIRQRTTQHVKDAATARVNDIKGLVVDDAGIRWDRIGTAALATITLVVVINVLRGIGRLFRH